MLRVCYLFIYLLFFSAFFPLALVEAQNLRPLPSQVPERLESLRYNEVQFKVAFNSRTQGSLEEQLNFDPLQPWDGGCLGVELDVVQNPDLLGQEDAWEFVVQSGGKFLAHNPSLRSTLQSIRKWSEGHPGHHVITIHINLKSQSVQGDDRAFCEKMDQILSETLSPGRIFKPAYLQRDASTLLEGAKKYGWPSLEELRNSFIVVLSGDDSNRLVSRRRMVYAYTDPYKRLAFVDIDQQSARRYGKEISIVQNPIFREGSRVFLNVKFSSKGWENLVAGLGKEGLVTRVWKANTRREWEVAKSSSVNMIATEKVYRSPWTALVQPKNIDSSVAQGELVD